MSETLPKGWFYTKLGNISTHPQYGWTCSANSIGKLKLLRTTDISNGKINWENVPFCEKEPDNDEKYLLNENDILVSRAGSVGISYRVTKSDIFHRAVFASYLIRFCPFVPASFVEHFFKSHLYWQYISDSQLGIAIPNVNATKLSELSIPLPPLNEQKRIAAKLDKIIPRIEAVKERLDKVPAIIKRFRQSVLTAAVTGKLTEKWRAEHPDVESAEALLKVLSTERIKLIEKGILKNTKQNKPKDIDEIPHELPQEWNWTRFNSITKLITDGKHGDCIDEMNSGFYFLSAKDVKDGNLVYENSRQISYSDFIEVHKRTNLEAGDICLVNTGATVGKVAIAKDNELTSKTTFQKSVAIIKLLNASIKPQYISMFLIRENENLLKVSKGSAVNNLLLGTIKDLLIPLPPLEEQKEIVRQVDKLFAVADRLETHYKNAKAKVDKLSQSVLAKAFRGELVITEAELAEKEGRDFESAEELLKRIQKEKERLSQDSPRTRKKKREEHEKD